MSKKNKYISKKVKEDREEPEDALTIIPGKQHLTLEEAAHMAAEAGKTYGEMFAPEVVVDIPDWAKY